MQVTEVFLSFHSAHYILMEFYFCELGDEGQDNIAIKYFEVSHKSYGSEITIIIWRYITK